MAAITLVFVHGWSVTNLDTYGGLPARLKAEAAKSGVDIDIKDIFLGRYISFHDSVRLPDISRAFQTAVADQLAGVTDFMCITHSTGGPVIRDWWSRYCKGRRPSPHLSHLIMLAPANFGSALAVLGKGTLSRLKSWWNGIEPGQGVLDWLSLGSAEAWALNAEWIQSDGSQINPSGFFPFVLTGQSIDRKLYDAVNSYTGETGSDGVVRTAAASLNATYIELTQPVPVIDASGNFTAAELEIGQRATAPPVPLRVISGKSHSGTAMGIMASVGANDLKSMETVNAILECMAVKTKRDYTALVDKFATDTERVQAVEQVETEGRLLLTDRHFIHDRYTMLIFRLTDSEGYPIRDFDLMLTAGADSNPNHLPEGFLADRQQNKSNPNIVTFYLNYDLLVGSAPVLAPDGSQLRPATVGIDMLGVLIKPRPDSGFVRYLPCKYTASQELFRQALSPNSTTMIDIVMQRLVDKEVFRLETKLGAMSFANIKPSNTIVT